MSSVFGDIFGEKFETEAEARRANWIGMFRKGFVNNFGQHMLICGITGSGKTQAMFWVLHELKAAEENGKRKEAVVWFDTGKSDIIKKSTEFLTLLAFEDLNILVPKGCEVRIKNEEFADMVKIREFKPDNFWDKIERRRINVACLEPFLRTDTVLYGKIFTQLFTQLIDKAHNLEVKTPMALFFDEFHRLCPARIHDAVSAEHYKLGGIIQMNIERLRSLGIRFVASTHGITKMKAAVRSSFQWRLYKRYIGGLTDEDRLKDYRPLLMKLAEDECIISYPNGTFSDILSLPFYGYFGGFVEYKGEITEDFVTVSNKGTKSQTNIYITAMISAKAQGFAFNVNLLKEINGIAENRVDVYLEYMDDEIAIVRFRFNEDGKYAFRENGEVWAPAFFKRTGLKKKIKGRSFKVQIEEETQSVLGYWEVMRRD